MNFFLSISRAIDAINTRIGQAVIWLTLVVVLVSATNAVVRKVFNVSSNAWLELQWYLFGAIFLLAAGYTFLRNEHVRVDVLSQRLSRRTQIYIEIFGIVFFLFPACALIFWLSLPFFYESLVLHELSSNTGGLIRWPVKLLIPVGFFLLILAGVSQLIKCVGFLKGVCPDPMALPDGKSAEEALADEIRRQAEQDAADATTHTTTGRGL
ncbi:TRAP transporter small permease subunit [Pollutimonas thiosulfatoxidans]|uniref:TRAP transporter small permease protein n=1 Tax=Pollutimonas thiosulfatoxidans TaxID=2028345 RepID=A0A410GAH1_9BURK|nr:TRAP transporter small permease subunit [Pollutimonas thiosulfatoxidans]MBF6617332.1 TRAP transporter small permease subunit [Candidimonas sp.]QAA93281.1 C4-dicarboxylate ABC transporter substrate-binding protein [Pollutimonas thiosulfatoxidans]